jgi:hypothetical protein
MNSFADVAELADAQVSEACDGDIVEVQVLSSAPAKSMTNAGPLGLAFLSSIKFWNNGTRTAYLKTSPGEHSPDVPASIQV